MNEDKATRYQRIRRRMSVLGLGWSVLFMAGLVVTGWSVGLRATAASWADRVAGGFLAPSLTVLFYVVLLAAIDAIGSLPLGWYGGYVLERKYGLSNESPGAWALDRLKSFGLGILLGGGAAVLLYSLIRMSPDRWWLGAGLLFALLVVALTNLAPVLLLPLFYTVKPLDREALRVRLLALSERAGARILGVYEWGLGAKTRKANAALTGLGRTRRILVSDTMLAEYSDDEIEVVLAHELGHHVHGDIWRGIGFETVLILAGFYLASKVLAAWSVAAGLTGVSDPAGLPLLLLAAGAVSLLMMPVAHALSRAHERRADRFALEMTRNAAAFISAMRRLGAQNLAEDNPSRVVQWLFYSHPPVRERIASAQGFRG